MAPLLDPTLDPSSWLGRGGAKKRAGNRPRSNSRALSIEGRILQSQRFCPAVARHVRKRRPQCVAGSRFGRTGPLTHKKICPLRAFQLAVPSRVFQFTQSRQPQCPESGRFHRSYRGCVANGWRHHQYVDHFAPAPIRAEAALVTNQETPVPLQRCGRSSNRAVEFAGVLTTRAVASRR